MYNFIEPSTLCTPVLVESSDEAMGTQFHMGIVVLSARLKIGFCFKCEDRQQWL